ncbi:site-specific integrase [Chromobacterium sp. IRSSSOUMB001]|uniref:site-specific integrase n=1 Tax=Chromobacterium sp. IRSSSOUMB001 TaxID=2927123 RepID=UPI0023DEB5B4|nr:site-specific integrase [Chromobacterium sp. IRSSSOUMB001]
MNARRHISESTSSEQLDSHIVHTRYGIEFDARCGWWPIDGKRGLDVDSIRALVSPALLPGLETTLRHACTKYSWATLSQYRWALMSFREVCFPGGTISAWQVTDFRRYRKALLAKFGHEDALRHIRSLLVNWHSGKHAGVSGSLIASLREMRLKGVEAGRAVRTMDPNDGPLTPEESHHLLQDLSDATEAGRLDIEEFSLAYFHIATGRRPSQSAALKCKDVQECEGDPEPGVQKGPTLYLLAVPRAKQRGHAFRETRRAIDLTFSNFQVFRTQRESVKHAFAGLLNRSGWVLQSSDMQVLLGELPLYPAWPAIIETIDLATQIRDGGEHGKALQALHQDAKGMAWHRTPAALSKRITAICDSAQTQRRDSKLLHVSAARLRHTKGTELAREGLPTSLIAWLLDHSTSRSAEIYIDNLPEHAGEIDRAVSASPTLQRFASAFRGTLVDSEVDAVAGHNAQSRVAYRGKNAATCGHLKQCGLDEGIPRACYTCSHFQPWLDGPHEEFLRELLTERANLVAELGPDSPVAKRSDKLIGAVQNVVQLCHARRSELDAVAGGGA